MSELKTKYGDMFKVDRDYFGALGEDVDLTAVGNFAYDERVVKLTPDEADELAEILHYHAEEARTINKENGLA